MIRALNPFTFSQEEEEDEEEMEAARERGITGMDIAMGEEGLDDGLPVASIDGAWIQRQIRDAFKDMDPLESQKLAEEVFEVLQVLLLSKFIPVGRACVLLCVLCLFLAGSDFVKDKLPLR